MALPEPPYLQRPLPRPRRHLPAPPAMTELHRLARSSEVLLVVWPDLRF